MRRRASDRKQPPAGSSPLPASREESRRARVQFPGQIKMKSMVIVCFSLIKYYFRDELLAGAEKLHPRDGEYKLQILTLPRICFTTCVANLPKDY